MSRVTCNNKQRQSARLWNVGVLRHLPSDSELHHNLSFGPTRLTRPHVCEPLIRNVQHLRSSELQFLDGRLCDRVNSEARDITRATLLLSSNHFTSHDMDNRTSRAHLAPRSDANRKHRDLTPAPRLPQNMALTRNASPEIPETPQGSPEPESLHGEDQADRVHRAAPQSRSARDKSAAAHNVPSRSKARGGAKVLEREEQQPSDVAKQLIRYTGIEARRQNDYTSQLLRRAPILNPYLLEMEKLGRDQPVRGEAPIDWQQAHKDAGSSTTPKLNGRALRIPLSSREEGVVAAAAAVTAATVAANEQVDEHKAVSTVLGIVSGGASIDQRPKKRLRTDEAQHNDERSVAEHRMGADHNGAEAMDIDSELPRVKGNLPTVRQPLIPKNVNQKLKTLRVSVNDDEKNNDIEMTHAHSSYRATPQRTIPESPPKTRPQRPSAAPAPVRNHYRELAYLIPSPDDSIFTSSISQETSSRSLTDSKIPRTTRPTWNSELTGKHSPPTDEQTASILVGMQYKPAINEAMPYGDLKYRVDSQSPFSEIKKRRMKKKQVEMVKKKEIEVIDLTMED
ncbi:hypothetical protein BST61_g5638 [Cercospora zeina]